MTCINVLVKVGRQSDILFDNKAVKAYRAITVHEMHSILVKHADINAIVIESITQAEYDEARNIIKSYIDRNGKVYFYIKDENDEATNGLADELDILPNLNLISLHNDMNNTFHMNVSNNVEIRASMGSTPNSDTGDGLFDTTFDETFETITKTQQLAADADSEVIQLPDIQSKDDLDDLDRFDDDMTTDSKVDTNIDEKVDTNESKSLDIFITKIHSLEVDKNDLESQLKTALDRISHLTEVNEAIADEKAMLKNLLESIQQSDDIVEDPVSSDEHQKALDQIDKLNNKCKELQDKIKTLEENSVNIDNNEEAFLAQLRDKDSELSKLKNDTKTLLLNIDSLEINLKAEVRNRDKLSELLKTAVDKLEIAREEITNKDEQNVTLKSDILKLKSDIESYIDTINNQSTKLESFKESEITIEAIKKSELTYTEQISEMTETISQLNSRIKDIESKKAESESIASTELNQLRLAKVELSSKLDIITAQLRAKEIQYDTLVSTCGTDINGINNILENTKTMDAVNKTLREQLITIKNELEQSNKDKLLAQQDVKSIEETNKQLRVSLKAMSTGINGGGSTSAIPPCNYSGKGFIIPVFGCGSYGITTTAMSIASKLSESHKVLYIDFDMISPTADAWFSINPVIQNLPEYTPGNARFTGLGLFIDRQIQYFLNYAQYLIFSYKNRKNGCLDYISGFYAKPDTIKLVSADYTSFFNYCGNNYAYVIVDFGRLGCSELNDQIIKVISDIAYRNIVVTTNDKFQVRTFRMKLDEARIDISNTAWLLNMCENTNMADMTKRSVGNRYSMMPFNPSLHGTKSNFTNDRLTKDKLDVFMSVLFDNKRGGIN